LVGAGGLSRLKVKAANKGYSAAFLTVDMRVFMFIGLVVAKIRMYIDVKFSMEKGRYELLTGKGSLCRLVSHSMLPYYALGTNLAKHGPGFQPN
jgi:hypothetical protein